MEFCNWLLPHSIMFTRLICVVAYGVVVESLSRVLLFAKPWTAACQAPLTSTISHSLFKHVSSEWVMLSNQLILCHPLLLLPSKFPSIRVFSRESTLLIRWSKYWSSSFSISSSNEYSGLISFRIDWFDLLAVQGTLKSLFQHHNLKAPILRHSAFIMVQLSHLYMTIGKTIALTIWTFVCKVMSLLFDTLPNLSQLSFQGASVLISWLQSPSTVILEPKKIKSVVASTFPPSICHRTGCYDLSFLNVEFQVSLSSLILIKRHFSSSSLSAIRVVSSAYLKLLIFLPEVLIPACDSSSLAFCRMYSA